MRDRQQYQPLSAKAVIELAAPHTWSASILPVGLGTALSCNFTGAFDDEIFLATLCGAVLLQCAVNTLNDYADFVKGTDNRENSNDSTDAALVYHGINPRSALKLGLVFLLLAAVYGVLVYTMAGFLPILIGIIGTAVVLLYSFGPRPISYLPIGELFSGVVMGGGITMACFTAQSGVFSWHILWYALPMMLTIGLIMLTNNTCDIARDRMAGRRTFPVLVGHTVAAPMLKGAMIVAQILVFVIAYLSFRSGFFLLPVAIAATGVQMKNWLNLPITSKTRTPSMGGSLALHKTINLGYILMIFLHLLQNFL